MPPFASRALMQIQTTVQPLNLGPRSEFVAPGKDADPPSSKDRRTKMRRGLTVLVSAPLLMAALMPSTSTAASSTRVKACAKKKNGQLRVVSSKRRCR
jgi:hypothetical protein